MWIHEKCECQIDGVGNPLCRYESLQHISGSASVRRTGQNTVSGDLTGALKLWISQTKVSASIASKFHDRLVDTNHLIWTAGFAYAQTGRSPQFTSDHLT